MISLTIDPVYLEVGAPALAIGFIVGALLVWLIGRHQRKALLREIATAEGQLKNQAALQAEREAAFELANLKLTQAFTNLSNQSLKSNSESFLRLAEQNLGTQQERAKRELSEREKAVEALVKPIRDSLEASPTANRRAGEGAQRSLWRYQESARGNAAESTVPEPGNPEPGECPAAARGTGPLGRNHSAAAGRAGRHGRALRFR